MTVFLKNILILSACCIGCLLILFLFIKTVNIVTNIYNYIYINKLDKNKSSQNRHKYVTKRHNNI